ncbi:MAG: TonB-dependent receptor [Hyphomonadaceae bacterium JAD_PAG50586_4]|nr:MAG: TonB-dependent receptor [Hyphomonadaceae bacterium JAD_PAG50586_4]
MSTKRLWAGAAMLAFVSAGPAFAQTSDIVAADESGGEEIIVFGRGETRQQSSITADAIAIEAPGTSPLKAIERLPGVSFQSADPFGSYEWSARVSLRGFNQNQLGFTLDGVPLGDMSYGNHNGLHISRAAIADNVARVDVAQGSGALGTASASNLGGTVQFAQRRPSEEFGIDVGLTAGSDQMLRGLVRLDTGAVLGGLRGSLSYADQSASKWKGWGEQVHRQFGASAVAPIGAGELYGFFNWSERRENDYQDMTLEMIDRLGADWDNISNDWDLAVDAADAYQNATPLPAPFATIDDAYFDASGLRDDMIGALRFEYPITEAFSVSAMVYGHQNEGQGLWWTPYVATPAGALSQSGAVIADPGPISVRTTEYDIERYGFVGSATLELGNHELEAGVWVEDNDFNQARRFYGTSRADQGRDSLEFQSNPFATQWEYDFTTETQLLYVQDTWSVTDALTVFAGFKSLTVENSAATIVGDNKDGTIEASDDFIPQAGFAYDLNDNHQIFGSFAENMRAYESSATGGPFSATAAGFAALRETLEPETSRTYELGWRFRVGDFQGSAAIYDVEFENRLLTVALGAPIEGLGNGIQNVGGVEAQGFELAALWQMNDAWSLFGSYSHNESTYADNVLDGTGALVAATAGKTVVNTPENLFRVELGYDNGGGFFGTLAAAYTGERAANYLNDVIVDAYSLFELTAGYRFQNAGPLLDGTEIQFNVTNLTDEDYISTVGSGGFGNSGDNQTFLPGAPQQVFVTLRRRF